MSSEIKPKKKVLFIITQSEFGGAQRFLSALLSRLDQSRFAVTVAFGKAGARDFLEQELTLMGLAVHRLKYLSREISPLNDWRSVFEIRKLIKTTGSEVLFLMSSKAGFVGALASVFPTKIKNLKVIYRIGGWTFNDPWSWWKKRCWIFLEKISAKWKDVIIVNNEHDLKQAGQLKIRPRGKLLLIHNGIDPYKTAFLPREEARLKIFGQIASSAGIVVQTKIIIGTIANFYPAKGLPVLVQAAEQFKNQEEIIFAIIGDGPERPFLEKTIAEKKLEKKFFLLGQIPEAGRFLPAFDIFVLSSLKEGFPWVVLEAMSAKIPVIASSVGAVPEIIENGQNGLTIPPDKPETLANKIKELLGNERLRQEMGLQGHQTVLFKFSLDKMIRETEKLL